MRKKLAVLISNKGTGSNLQAIIDAIKTNTLNATITVVISDSKDAQGLTKAEHAGLSTHILKKDENITTLLQKTYPVDFVVLAGWKKIIPDTLITAFKNKILNLHPGLIPDSMQEVVKNPDGTNGLWNKGKLTNTAIAEFLKHNATYAGSSIHFLTHEFDFGPVLGRTFEKVYADDTIDTLYTRLKKKENRLYVETLQQLCNE